MKHAQTAYSLILKHSLNSCITAISPLRRGGITLEHQPGRRLFQNGFERGGAVNCDSSDFSDGEFVVRVDRNIQFILSLQESKTVGPSLHNVITARYWKRRREQENRPGPEETGYG